MEVNPSQNRPPTLESQPKQARCQACQQLLEPGDAYCRHCGRRQDKYMSIWYHPGVVLLLGLTVLGPVALPMVFLSRRMNTVTKAIVATIIIISFLIAMFLTVKIAMVIIDQYRELNKVMTNTNF